MNDYLTKLGINPDIQALFKIQDGCFDYGDAWEVCKPGYYFLPATRNLWIAGNPEATEVMIARSAMDCLAFISINGAKVRRPDRLCFIALGCHPIYEQIAWIAQRFDRRKKTLLFENDVSGRATDVFVAAALKKEKLTLNWLDGCAEVIARNKIIRFTSEELSLNAFEKSFGIRTQIRTRKPLHHSTFFNQLTYDYTR